MDNSALATVIGVGVQAVSTILQSYVTFKRTNVEKYFQLLLNENKDLSKIGTDEKLQRLFYSIIDNVSKEIAEEKINNWKNLTVKLATEIEYLDFSENYSKALAELTAFDLTVLFAVYANEFKSKFFNSELIKYFQDKKVDQDKVCHSLKGLARYYLVTEQADGTTYLTNGEPSGQRFFYEKNNLGKDFLRIIGNQ